MESQKLMVLIYIIAENMWRSVNNEGYQEDSLHSIVDIRFKKNAVKDSFMYNQNGKRIIKKTTHGVDLQVVLKSGINSDGTDKTSKSWIPLKELKESHPLEVAEFSVAHGVDQMPAFKWWVSHTLKKRDAIIASVRKRITQTTHKYGIEIPTSWDHAVKIDRKNNNRLWRDAVAKEMKNVGVAFDVLESHQNVPVGWTKRLDS